MFSTNRFLAAMCCVLSLAGCRSGGGPSDDQIASAMWARFQDFSGVQLLSVKNQGCTAVEAPSKYSCAVSLEVQMQGTPKLKGLSHVEMTRTGDTWAISSEFQMPGTPE